MSETMAGPKAYAGTLQLPMSSTQLRRDRLAKPDRDAPLLIAEIPTTPDGSASGFQIVGHIGLEPSWSLRRRHVMGIGMAVTDEWQGRGVGSALMRAAIDRADNWMNVLRLELTVFTDNEPALALYRRFGFVIEGTHRAYALRDGRFVDAHAMARLHPNPPMLPVLVEDLQP